jgi:hypothetical protein
MARLFHTSLYGERLYFCRRGVKYLVLILQRYGLVEGTPNNEASSLLLRYARRPRPFLRPEGYGRRDVLLQFAMLLCLVSAIGYQAEPFRRR